MEGYSQRNGGLFLGKWKDSLREIENWSQGKLGSIRGKDIAELGKVRVGVGNYLERYG